MGRLSGKRSRIADLVIEEIQRMLFDGELSEGDKLPNQTEFAEQLGVSRPSLREALNLLSQMGAIKQKPGVGTIIMVGDPRLWGQKLTNADFSDAVSMMELIQARKCIEPLIARLAAQQITEEEIAVLSSDVDCMQDSLYQNKVKKYLQHDLSFHFHTANASRNRYIIHMFVAIRSSMEESTKEAVAALPELVESSLSFHRRILDSLKHHNAEQAERTMKEHIGDIEIRFSNYYRLHDT